MMTTADEIEPDGTSNTTFVDVEGNSSEPQWAETIRGRMLLWPFDGPISDSLLKYGEWGENEIGLLAQFVKTGDTVIDAGANIGSYTLAFADWVGQQGRVIAIEASEEISHLLRVNVETNKLDQVTVLSKALTSGDRVSIPRLDSSVRFNAGSLAVSGKRSFSNNVETIELDALDIDKVDFIKLDIEGSELAALRSSVALLNRCRPVVFCEFSSIDQGIELVTFMEQCRYKSYFVSSPAFNAQNYNRCKVNIFGHAREAGLLFLPSEHAIPQQSSGANVRTLHSFQDLVEWFLHLPRYGDATDYDRIASRLVSARDGAQEGLALARSNAAVELSHAQAQTAVLKDEALALKDEALRLKMELAMLQAEHRQSKVDLVNSEAAIIQARCQIADLRQSVMKHQIQSVRNIVASVEKQREVEVQVTEATHQQHMSPSDYERCGGETRMFLTEGRLVEAEYRIRKVEIAIAKLRVHGSGEEEKPRRAGLLSRARRRIGY